MTDASITAAGRALSAGDPLRALRFVALGHDPSAVALRGIALAQLGDWTRSRALLRRAARGFGPRHALARARCRAAEAEVALAARDLLWSPRALEEARRTFAAHGERVNATHARLLQLRRLLLLGRIDSVAAALSGLELTGAPAHLLAMAALIAFELALRQGRAERAGRALSVARLAAARAGIAALRAEVEQAGHALTLPAARLVTRGEARSATLAEVEAVLASPDLVVDGCRRAARYGERVLRLSRRPALFAVLSGLAAAWPGEAARGDLIELAFGARRTDASYRVRLRVAMGRLREALRPLAGIRTTAHGYQLVARGEAGVRLLAPPVESADAAVLALLADGEAWSTSALAMALGVSQRTAQRALSALVEAGQVRALGRGRSRRWLAPPAIGFATMLLLPFSGREGSSDGQG